MREGAKRPSAQFKTMNKKTLFIFILVIILFAGGFFLFSKGGDIFKNNRLLAAIKEFSPFGKTEEPPSSLVLLEQELKEKYESFQRESANQIDEMSEKVDLLDQKITEMEAQIQTLGVLISEKETEEETGIELENQETEEEKTDEAEKEEQEQIICQKITGSSTLKNKVIIDEIAWMGTTVSANDEWIELKNISGVQVDLAGWQLLDNDQNIKIIFDDKDKIGANNFYLLERSDDNSVLNVKADKIYTGALTNENENLYLFDENCQLQDEVETNPDWSAGDNSSKRTMERKGDLTWQTSFNPDGTPRATNSSGYTATPPVTGGGGGSPPPPSYSEILITEIKISPIEERFIELYNPNNNPVILTDWYIQRKTETGTSWNSLVSSTNFEGKVIQPQNYFLIAKTDENADIISDLTLTENNSLALKNPNGEIVDKVGYGQAQEFETTPTENPLAGESIGRKWISENLEYQDTNDNSTDFEIGEATPGLKNQKPAPSSQDTIPPQVSFNISSLQTTLSFKILWQIDDTVAPATPETTSGIAVFVLRWKEEGGNWQEDAYQEIAGTPPIYDGEKEFTGEDGKTYYFQIKAKDKAENKSEWSPEPPVSTKIEQKKESNCLPGQININTAPEEELQKITGIGPVLAQRIIEARPFYSLDDLIKVSGIGEKTLQKIKEQGLACVE